MEGEVENMDWITGRYNGIMVCGAPVEPTAVFMVMGVCAMGHGLPKMHGAIIEDEIEGALDKSS